jgi:hypothetical protein
MDEHQDHLPQEATDSPAHAPAASAEAPAADRSRRDFLQGSARKLAYAAPLVLLFHPTPACASGGSQLTQP